MEMIFLHGLESSSRGNKARWFRKHFPDMLIPDFRGTLKERMDWMRAALSGKDGLVLVGSSFGGLMAAIYAQENENRVKKVVLLAPALNFPEFSTMSSRRVTVPATLYIGSRDTVCPPEHVIPLAQKIFSNLSIHVSDDDHFLRDTFVRIKWSRLLADSE